MTQKNNDISISSFLRYIYLFDGRIQRDKSYTNYKIHHKNFSTYDSNVRILVENHSITLDSNDVLSIQLNPIWV